MTNTVQEKKSVLIVEDEDILREALAEEFQLAQFETFEASRVSDAISLLATNKVDVILSDMRMPGGNGDVLLTHVRSQSESAPVFMFLTGYSDLSDSELYHRGAERIFSKPFEIDKLLETVRDHLRDKKQRWSGEAVAGISTLIEGKSVNVGRGGFYVSMSQRIARVGEIVRFSVFLNQQRIEGSGYVRWIKNKSPDICEGMGIEFCTLTPESFDILNNYLTINSKNSYIPNSEES